MSDAMIDILNRETAQDLARVRARAAAIDVLSAALAELAARGFRPHLARETAGLVVLTLDMDRIEAALPPLLAPPAPAPEPAPKPAPPRRRVTSPAPPRDTGPIAGDERELAFDLLASGLGPAEVARRLDRPAKQLANLKQNHNAEIARRAGAPVTPEPKPEPVTPPVAARDIPAPAEPPPAPAPVTPAPAPAVFATPAMPPAERAIHAHLDAVGYSGTWTAASDLALAEALCRGDGAAGAAAALGLGKEDVIARWARINTERGSIEHQARLLRALRARAGG